MEFCNEIFEEIVNVDNELSADQIDAYLKQYPRSKQMLVSLIGLIKLGDQGVCTVDDWECDFSNQVWPEVMSVIHHDRIFVNRSGSVEDVRCSLSGYHYTEKDLQLSIVDEQQNKNRKSVVRLLEANIRKINSQKQ